MISECSDWQLLREYVHQGSQAAFAALVERHINFVYSTCLREVHNAAVAEDVTQVVFLILARKAPSLRETGTLAGWLYKTSCFTAKNALRQEVRRRRHEMSSMQELIDETATPHGQTPDSGWEQLEELLHEALSTLNSDQRNVIFLRFFEGKSVRDAGEALGISEKAAERRLSRALEKMRRHCAGHGHVFSLAAIATLLAENAVQAAPTGCVSTVLHLAQNVTAGGAVAGGTGAASSMAGTLSAPPTVVALSQEVLKAMLVTQIKTGIVASVGFCVMAGSTAKLAHYALASPPFQQQASTLIASTTLLTKAIAKQNKVAIDKASKDGLGATPDTAPEKKTPSTTPFSVLPELTPQPHRTPAPIVSQAAPRPLSASKSDSKSALRLAQLRLLAAPAGIPPGASVDNRIKPKTGEIAVEGVLIAVTNGRLIVDVSAFTLPNGKTTPLNPPKPKTILMTKQTMMHVRGQSTPVTIIDLRPEIFILAVGADKGSGEALPARDVSVWDSVRNGVFQWGEQAMPLQPVKVLPAEAALPADAPPDAEASEFPNEFPEGDFQKDTPGNRPAAWQISSNAWAGAREISVQEAKGKRWLKISTAIPNDWRLAVTTVPLKPEWKQVRIAAQMKVKNLARGPMWWNTARVTWRFVDNRNRTTASGRGLNLYEDTDWTSMKRTAPVPPGSTKLVLEMGSFNSAGELSLDNIRVEANAPLDGLPLNPEALEDDFEKPLTIGLPAGLPETYALWGDSAVGVVTEEGNRFVRLTKHKPEDPAGFDLRYKLPPEWTAIRLKARMRVKDLQLGEQFWQNARITPIFENDMGERVGGFPRLLDLKKDTGWKTMEIVNPIPQGATLLRLQTGVLGPSGVLDIDDIDLEDASNADLPSLPIVAGLPGGTFEELDEDGWPLGWRKANGKPEIFGVVEEDGNHILRLSSQELIYGVAEARFKLPKDWKGLIVSGRLRAKNVKRLPDAKDWQSPRLGFSFENARGEMAGGFQQSLELHTDSDWKTPSVKTDIPRDAIYVKVAVVLQNSAAIFDVDDLRLEEGKPTVILPPVYEWTRQFPEGSFEYKNPQGGALGWNLDTPAAKILEEEGNHFLRLASDSNKNTVLLASEWRLKPQWKEVRVRARMRGRDLKTGTNPLDAARLQFLFLNSKGEILTPAPAPLQLNKDTDWVDMQSKATIPTGATTIKLMLSLSRTSGTLDVDDISIEPVGMS